MTHRPADFPPQPATVTLCTDEKRRMDFLTP